jgi:hypothetical protein
VAVTDSVYKKFGKEDAFKSGSPGAGGGAGSDTLASLSAEQKVLMADPAYSDWRNPKHAEIKAKNAAIMDRMRAIKK